MINVLHTVHVEMVVLLSHRFPDSHIPVMIEFGDGEGKVPLEEIARRADAYKPNYIAELKRNLGLPMYDASNAVEKLKEPRKHPTSVQVDAIKDRWNISK